MYLRKLEDSAGWRPATRAREVLSILPADGRKWLAGKNRAF